MDGLKTRFLRNQDVFLEARFETYKPAELADFSSALSALDVQFSEHLKLQHPNLHAGSKVLVNQIKEGSIIVELIPFVQPLIQNMDAALVVDGFVKRYGGILGGYLGNNRLPDAKKSDLDCFMGQVAMIANDEKGVVEIRSAEFDQTKSRTRASLKFDSKQAKLITQNVEAHKLEIETKSFELYKKVLMVFWQSNLKESELGKRTGEKAIIEEVSNKPLAVVYDSDLAEEKIKTETKSGDRNLYKLGFYVDCRVEKLNGKPVALRIGDVGEIIELPD